jgi:hypothetical protein
MTKSVNDNKMIYLQELEKLHEMDKVTVKQAVAWLSQFWWENRPSLESDMYRKEEMHSVWETERLIQAIINLRH